MPVYNWIRYINYLQAELFRCFFLLFADFFLPLQKLLTFFQQENITTFSVLLSQHIYIKKKLHYHAYIFPQENITAFAI